MTTGVGSLEPPSTRGPTPVSKRVSPTDRLRAEVDALFGRARYQRRDLDGPAGRRNGWQPPTSVKTTMGAVELQRPKLRGTDQAFCSRLFGAGVTRTNALESLVISGWVRGLSDRDIEATLAEVLGPEAALSKSTASRICQRIGEEFTAWRARALSGVRLDYLFLDASHFKMHPGAPAEPVLAAWGITTDGKPVFVGLGPAASESTDAWDDFLSDLVGRGLGAPLLGISDGAAGLTARSRARCGNAAWSTVPATSSPRSPSTTMTRSAATTGRSSTSATPNPATTRSASRERRPRRSRPSGARATRRRSPASPATWRRSRCTCGSRPNTGTASVTPTSSSGPSARLVGGPR